jgi:hypothetical protein
MIDTATLGDEIATLAAKLSAGTHELLACIRQFDAAEGWHHQGALTCAHWLTWRISVDPATAREKVRVARALGALPRIDGAFAQGRLSYAQVRAMTRVATPENEENLLMIAQAANGAQLERICRRFRTAKAAIMGWQDADAAADRCIRARTLGGGLVKLEIVVGADEAEMILQAVERARDELRSGQRRSAEAAAATVTVTVTEVALDVSAEAPPDKEQRQTGAPRPVPVPGKPAPGAEARPKVTAADALVHVATSYLAGGPTSAETAGDRYQVIVHLERDLMRDGEGVAASLDDGTAVSAETFRRIACDAGLVAAAMGGAAHAGNDNGGAAGAAGDVLDIGRKTRVIPVAIRRALWLRDRGCRFPGCANHRFLHGHHIQHWLHGGPTSLANLISLCSFHHRQVHEGGFTLRLTPTGEVEVQTPTRSLLPSVPTLAELNAPNDVVLWLDSWTTHAGGHIDAWTATSSWDGENVDYGACVEALMVGMEE